VNRKVLVALLAALFILALTTTSALDMGPPSTSPGYPHYGAKDAGPVVTKAIAMAGGAD
jgi:hypothetical protein